MKLLTQEYRNYLNDLRDSAVTNMFGAAPYLADEYGLSIRDARQIVSEWMQEYK